VLSNLFRGMSLDGLTDAYERGELELEHDLAGVAALVIASCEQQRPTTAGRVVRADLPDGR
jgi:hypothetical protein